MKFIREKLQSMRVLRSLRVIQIQNQKATQNR